MSKTGIDQEALVDMFSQATAKQGAALTQGVTEATLRALQARELSLKNIKSVLKTVTEAASAGAAKNTASPVDVEAMLGKAFAGMDAALLQAVEANRKALQQFVDQGIELKDKRLATALTELEKMEDTFFSTLSKTTQAAGPMAQPWQHVLEAMKLKGTDTGAQATNAVQTLMSQTQTALRDSRAAGLKAAQAMIDSYSALVSGVLIGMSQGLKQGGAAEGVAATEPPAGGSDAGGARTSRKR
ncbi:MAG: hypothetical protein JWP52_3413 [Rhizobacter sp.]|nr:hypothetical protein [Rhizobacter sp.]